MPRLLSQLASEAAERHGERAAVVMDGTTLTWAQLEAQANRFAHALHANGVRRHDRVGLWLPRSPEAIVALYGAMKLGATYVPVDPGAPAARLAYMARDCQLAALVTHRDRMGALAAEFADDAPMRAIWLADDAAGSGDAPRIGGAATHAWGALAAESSTAPANPAGEDDLALILYTSGSTGEPKGVMLSHRNVRAFTDWAATTFALTAEDRVANHAPFHFDLSTFDLFASARVGAAIYPVSPRIFAFPAAVAKRWCEDKLSVWYCTPSHLTLMLTRGGLERMDLSALRVLLFAGEVFPVQHLRRLMALAPQARFANLYGPTETNVCTWHELAGPPAGDAPVPIGKVCPYDHALVLDEALAPVAPGGTGELWIHGESVMQGYWDRPERTALAVQELETAPGVRVRAYRTGDLVRADEHGAFEFLGRRDHQVKTRGYRVELGEIEVRLSAHPQVDEAVVVAIPDEEITHRLHAFIVATPGGAPTADALREHCAALLPRYMVPESIVIVEQLPRTSSGKIDRRALAQT